MAKNKIGLQFTGWEELMTGIGKVAGEAGLKQATEDALKASKQYVNSKIKAAMQNGNLPAKGKYSRSPHTLDSLNKDMDVKWSGFTGEVKVGFDIKDKGLVSIFLMYGTPRMSKDQELYDAVYGKKTKSEIRKIQKEAISKYIERNL